MRTIAPGRAAVADLRSKITAADYAIMARVSAASSPALDRAMPALSRAMPALSRAANYSRLWMGIAAGLAASENKWGRRAALRGVAKAGQQSFLNTASTGVYVDLVRAREELEERLGKWPAVVVALVRVLHGSRPQDLVVNGRRRRIWLLFAGNCRYEPAGAAPSYRPDLSDGRLDIRMIDGSQPLARARLIAAVAMGTLARSRVYRTWTAPELTIETTDGSPIQLSTDGEVMTADATVTLRKRRDPLLVYRPES
jgi:undecaprenyl-diphosphatase